MQLNESSETVSSIQLQPDSQPANAVPPILESICESVESDILFFIKSIKNPSDKFDILNYTNFTTGSTRSAGTKLYPKTAHINPIMNSYFYRLPRLWNSLPIIDLSQSLDVIKPKLKAFLWNHFLANFDNTPCTFHYLCPCTRCSKTPAPTNYNYL